MGGVDSAYLTGSRGHGKLYLKFFVGYVCESGVGQGNCNHFMSLAPRTLSADLDKWGMEEL